MKKLITTIAFIALSTVSAKAIEMEMFSITGGIAANNSVWGATATQDEYNAAGTAVDASSDRKLAKDRACYVAIYQAPLNVWKTYKKGGYTRVRGHKDVAELGLDETIRLGSYGDPSAIPA